MIRSLMLVVLALGFTGAVRAADDVPMPYKNAKVGDWVEYKMASGSAKANVDIKQKRTVTEKTDTTITIEMAMSVMGRDIKHSQTFNLDQKFDPSSYTQRGPTAEKSKGEYKEVARGEESLTVGGKSLACVWMSYEVSGDGKGGKAKIWRNADVPLGGMVKMEAETAKGAMTMELVDFGNGK